MINFRDPRRTDTNPTIMNEMRCRHRRTQRSRDHSHRWAWHRGAATRAQFPGRPHRPLARPRTDEVVSSTSHFHGRTRRRKRTLVGVMSAGSDVTLALGDNDRLAVSEISHLCPPQTTVALTQPYQVSGSPLPVD